MSKQKLYIGRTPRSWGQTAYNLMRSRRAPFFERTGTTVGVDDTIAVFDPKTFHAICDLRLAPNEVREVVDFSVLTKRPDGSVI